MLTFFFYSIWAINATCFLIRRKSKLIEAVTCVLVVVLFLGNTFNGDYYAYLGPYESHDLSEFEIGFQVAAVPFFMLDLPYDAFKGTLYIACLIAIYSAIKKTEADFHLFVVLYFSILVFYDIDQLRNFVMSTFVTMGILLLAAKKRIAALVFMMIGSSFQVLGLVYLLLVPINPRLITKNNYMIIICTTSIALCLITYLLGGRIPFVSETIFAVTGSTVKASVYGAVPQRAGFLIPFTLHAENIALVYLGAYGMNEASSEETGFQFELAIWTKALVVIGLLTFPLIIWDLSFDRIVRNFSYLCYLVAGIGAYKVFESDRVGDRFKAHYLISITILVVVYCVSWHIGIPFRSGSYPTEEYLILTNNLLMA